MTPLPADWSTPAAAPPEGRRRATAGGVSWTAAAWSPAALARLGRHLAGPGARALVALTDDRLLAAWSAAVDEMLDPTSLLRRRLAAPLAALCRLSPEGLAAGLEAVLGGVRREPAARLLAAARDARGKALAAGAGRPRAPALVLVAANLPALAVQTLLPALAVRRPVILKSPSSEPLFAPAFAAELARREPALGEAVAALTWRGGDADLEAPLLAAADPIVAYGEAATLADLERRAAAAGGGRLVGYGPKTSLAVVAGDADPGAVAAGLGRDVALFDQRGCLSVAAVYVEEAGDRGNSRARAVAAALAAELERLGRRWPPGRATVAERAAVRQLREEAALAGLAVWEAADGGGLDRGTVVVDPEPAFRPTPGLRTLRVQPLPAMARLPTVLAPWAGRLQGAALAGAAAWELVPALGRLGVSRFAAPGELQSPDATWHNGGVDPLAALAGG